MASVKQTPGLNEPPPPNHPSLPLCPLPTPQAAEAVLSTQVSKGQSVVLQLKEEAAKEQALVAQLKQQAQVVKVALVKEQQLVVDVKKEMQNAVDGRTRMVSTFTSRPARQGAGW